MEAVAIGLVLSMFSTINDPRASNARHRLALQLNWLTAEQRTEWAGLKSVVVVESTRKLLDKTEQFRRYYLSSLPPVAKELGRLIRNHWAIENGQHWCLDMGFNEDQSRVRTDHSDENLAAIRRTALNLLKQDKSRKIGISNKRLKACGN